MMERNSKMDFQECRCRFGGARKNEKSESAQQIMATYGGKIEKKKKNRGNRTNNVKKKFEKKETAKENNVFRYKEPFPLLPSLALVLLVAQYEFYLKKRKRKLRWKRRRKPKKKINTEAEASKAQSIRAHNAYKQKKKEK
jgi:hypothetical protein